MSESGYRSRRVPPSRESESWQSARMGVGVGVGVGSIGVGVGVGVGVGRRDIGVGDMASGCHLPSPVETLGSASAVGVGVGVGVGDIIGI